MIDKEFESANPYSTPAVATAVVLDANAEHLRRYSTVRLGLQLIYYSVAAIAIAMIFFTVVVVFGVSLLTSRSQPSAGSTWLNVLPMLIVAVALIAASIAMLVGFCLCVACPSPDEKTRALIMVGAFVLSFIVGMASGFLSMIEPVSSLVLNGATQLLNAIVTLAFCLLLKQIGINISSDSLKRQSNRSIVWLGLMMAVFLIGVVTAAIGLGGSNMDEVLAMAWGITLMVLALGTFFQFLYMIRTGITELKPPQ